MAEHRGNVSGMTAKEEKSRNYGFALLTETVAGTAAYFFAGIEQFGKPDFARTGFHSFDYLFVADTWPELHSVPVEWICRECLTDVAANIISFLLCDRYGCQETQCRIE